MRYRVTNRSGRLPGFTGNLSLRGSNYYAGEKHPVHNSLIVPSIISNAAACNHCKQCIEERADLPKGTPIPRALKAKCNWCRWCFPESEVGDDGGGGSGPIFECRTNEAGYLECTETSPGHRWIFE